MSIQKILDRYKHQVATDLWDICHQHNKLSSTVRERTVIKRAEVVQETLKPGTHEIESVDLINAYYDTIFMRIRTHKRPSYSQMLDQVACDSRCFKVDNNLKALRDRNRQEPKSSIILGFCIRFRIHIINLKYIPKSRSAASLPPCRPNPRSRGASADLGALPLHVHGAARARRITI